MGPLVTGNVELLLTVGLGRFRGFVCFLFQIKFKNQTERYGNSETGNVLNSEFFRTLEPVMGGNMSLFSSACSGGWLELKFSD
jgi:hypothetical protein